jgi:hypothetical protein
MSQWTHVNGIVRIEKHIFEPGVHDKVGIDIQNAFYPPIEGSEGPLLVNVIKGEEYGSSNCGPNHTFITTDWRWILTVTGCLRDYGRYIKDHHAIVKWFNRGFKELSVREAIVQIHIDYKGKYVYRDRYNERTGRSILELIHVDEREGKV